MELQLLKNMKITISFAKRKGITSTGESLALSSKEPSRHQKAVCTVTNVNEEVDQPRMISDAFAIAKAYNRKRIQYPSKN